MERVRELTPGADRPETFVEQDDRVLAGIARELDGFETPSLDLDVELDSVAHVASSGDDADTSVTPR